MLRILIPSDGKPGHYKKAEAIARGIAASRPADIALYDVRLRVAFFHDVLRLHLRRHRALPGPRWLSLFYRLSAELPERPDLIISSGGKTAFINAWLAQHYGCPNAFIGGTRGVHDDYFARIIVQHSARGSHPAHRGDPRFVPSLIPTEITPELLAHAADAYAAAREPEFRGRRHWTLVLGGDSGGYRYRPAEWEALGAGLRTLAARHGIRWLITTSRRTSTVAETVLQRDDLRPHIDELQIYRTDPRRIYNALLGCGEVIFCTEDSGTMLTEAASAGRPLFSVRPRIARTTRAHRELLDYYSECGWLKRVTIDGLARLQPADIATGFAPQAEFGLSRVCERILDVLPAA